MANATLLSLFQNTLQGMGVATYGQPTTVVGNSNQDVTQLLALVNAGGDELARSHPWQALSTQHIFTAPYYSYTATVTDGSTSLSVLSSTAGLTTNPTYFMLTGTGILQDTFLVSVDAATSTAVISQAADATGTLVTLTFSQVLFEPPTAFDRQIDRTHWDKSKHWEMLGPETPQQREWLRSGYISTGPRIRYWFMGGYFQIWPPLGSTESLAYEYLSKYWIRATGAIATTKQAYTVDTDTCIFPDPLMRLLIKLKYFEIKGFDTTAIYRDYMAQVDLAKAHDAGSPTLSMAPNISQVLIGFENIPDSSFGS